LDTPVPGAFVLPSDEPVNVHHPKEWPAFIPSSAVSYWKGTYQIPETDDRGFVELRGLPSAVKMWLSLTGDFIPKKVECSIDPGKTFTELRIEVDAGAKVRGRVIDEGGVPLPREGVTLTLRPQPSFGGNALRSAVTDGEGRYEFLGLPREEVRVGVPELGSNSIVVKIEQDVVQLEDLVVPRGGEFSGRIVSSYPLADGKRFKVLLYSGGALASSAECEPSGKFKGTALARQGPRVCGTRRAKTDPRPIPSRPSSVKLSALASIRFHSWGPDSFCGGTDSCCGERARPFRLSGACAAG